MSCGNNCEGCTCTTSEVASEPDIVKAFKALVEMKLALEQVVVACTEEHWSKHDIKRIALAGLGKK